MEETKEIIEIKGAWLQKLKEESWEAELLVSTVSIFGSFQLFGLIEWWTNKFIDLLPPSQYLIGYMIVFFGLLAISSLVSMFVIHFILRAYWVGLVGLNSVFPDYSIEDSAYSPIYTEKLTSFLPKLKDSIQKLDDLCSVIFSVAFTFLFMFMYSAITGSIYLLIYNKLFEFLPSWLLLMPGVLILVLSLVSSVFGLVGNRKKNRENVELQTWGFKLVKFSSIILYGPLYKTILQITMIFGSNFKKRKSFMYLIILFSFSGLLVGGYQLLKTNISYLIVSEGYFDETKLYPAYYEINNKQNNFLLAPEIESDIIKGDVIKVFIPIFTNEDAIKDSICGEPILDETLSRAEKKKARRALNLKCYSQYHNVYLDDQKIEVSYLKNEHQRTHQFGIVTFIPIDEIPVGNHKLTVKKEANGKVYKSFEIPFYRE